MLPSKLRGQHISTLSCGPLLAIATSQTIGTSSNLIDPTIATSNLKIRHLLHIVDELLLSDLASVDGHGTGFLIVDF